MTIEMRHPVASVSRSHNGPRTVAPGRQSLVLAEPDADTAAPVIAAADKLGISIRWCRDEAEALLAVGAERPSVLVLAAHTDALDAARVVAAVRRHSDLSILVGAAPDDEAIARQALAAGASAVIARPYDIAAIAPFTAADSAVYIAGPLWVDRRAHEVRVGDREVILTQRELDLLVYLIQRRGRVADQEQICRAVWGHASDTNTVAVHIKRLREKLGEHPEHGRFIRTIRGVGYRLAPSLCG
jgi:DNA-binding response OmpR family regulator